MGLLKLVIASFASNVDSYLVEVKPTYKPNPINK